VTAKEPPQRADSRRNALLGQTGLDFRQRDIWLRIHEGPDGGCVRLNAPRSAVAAQWPQPRLTLFARQTTPATDTRCAHPETLTGFSMRGTCLNRSQNTNPQIQRQRSRHVCRPPAPADRLNHPQADLGIRLDSFSSETALERNPT